MPILPSSSDEGIAFPRKISLSAIFSKYRHNILSICICPLKNLPSYVIMN